MKIRKLRPHRSYNSLVPALALALVLLTMLLAPARPAAADPPPQIWDPLIERLAEDGVSPDYLHSLFSRPEVEYRPQLMARKMISLLKIKTQPRKPAAPQAAPGPESPKVYTRYLQPSQLANAYSFLTDYRDIARQIELTRNVPGEILVAILLVETRLGSYLGKESAFNTLASMALCEDFRNVQPYLPMNSLSPGLKKWLVRRTKQKAHWAYEELLAFVEYAISADLNPLAIRSSPYGAIGLCQFMPTNAIRFGVDGDNDGRVDLFDPQDAMHSVANYLVYHGWKAGMSEEKQMRVLYHYNHDHTYTRTIVEVAKELRAMREGG